MITKYRRVLLLVFLVSAGLSTAARAQSNGVPDDSTDAAEAAAITWLRQVDARSWTAAWQSAAPLLTDSLSEEAWQERAAEARTSLGPLRSRRLTRVQQRSTLAHVGTEGPFVLLRYRSEFARGLHVETVLTVWEDEAWKVGGYEVAPLSTSTGNSAPSSGRMQNPE